MAPRRIMLLGGHGLVGSHITRLLARAPDLSFLIVGRDHAAAALFVEFLLEEGIAARPVPAAPLPELLARERPDLLIDATGAADRDHAAARACIAARTPYLDVCDDRAAVLAIRALNPAAVAAGVVVLSGAGVEPCLTMAAAESLAVGLSRVDGVRVTVQRGNREEYGPAAVAGLLTRAGRPLRWRRAGAWEEVRGIQTRAPVRPGGGDAGVLLAYEAPELDLLLEVWPMLREATVWIGIELTLLGRGLQAVGWAPRLWPRARLTSWIGLFDSLARSFGHFGTGRSRIRVELEGVARGQPVTLAWTLTAGDADGGWLRAAPCVAAARQVLQGLTPSGARVARLDMREIMVELRGRDVKVNTSDMNR